MSGDAASQKVDLKKQVASYSARRRRFDLVEVTTMSYLMIEGSGDPNTAVAYREALETVYPVAYALKFLSKQDLGRDYVVPPLEALWWADDMEAFTARRDKSRWRWTVLILTPSWIGADEVSTAVSRVRSKGGVPRLDGLRWDAPPTSVCACRRCMWAPMTTRGP